jgi:hypothetical protein
VADYSFFRSPFLQKEVIHQKADNFREQHWGKGSLPVDMEKIIETRLSMYIEPRRDIAQLLHIDAYLTSDLSSIVVDYFQYMDEFRRYDRRLRFSFAHEVGHLELHRAIYDNFTIADPKEYYDFITNVPEADYRAFEFQRRTWGHIFICHMFLI